jgi:hypothetical protein
MPSPIGLGSSCMGRSTFPCHGPGRFQPRAGIPSGMLCFFAQAESGRQVGGEPVGAHTLVGATPRPAVLAGSSRCSPGTPICRIVAGCNASVCLSPAIRSGYRTSRFYPPPARGVIQSLA